jgi:hypothetical protein
MADFKMDSDGDLDISNGELHIVEGREAVAQEVRIGLRFFLGEWFLETRIGIPYFTDIFKKSPNLGVIQDIFRRAIESVPGVKRVVDITLDFNATTRTLSLSFSAETTEDGEDDEPLLFQEALVL